MTSIRRFLDYVNWDKIGIVLSAVCALHCVLTPFIILSLPMMARYYLANPNFHFIMALLILPVGLWAFLQGFFHHHKLQVLFWGVPGLLIVTFIPMLVHRFHFAWNEIAWMVVGSGFLIRAHWLNRKACSRCAQHRHGAF